MDSNPGTWRDQHAAHRARDVVGVDAHTADEAVGMVLQGPSGDVAADVMDVAGFVSPVPGGVGPMTRAMLLSNVVEAAERAVARA